MDLFDTLRDRLKPLADKARPQSLEDVVGQEHLTGESSPLRSFVVSGSLPSLILFGPPGVGKTTVARILARRCKLKCVEISAVTSGLADLRKVFALADQASITGGKRMALFIDEIHRFNRGQQDAILPHLERGSLILIGATTENPFFRVIPALRSRCQVFELRCLTAPQILARLRAVLRDFFPELELDPEALARLSVLATGDLRRALNGLEILAQQSQVGPVAAGDLEKLLGAGSRYDSKNEHYDCASAFQKSLRGSQPDAALYYLAKMLDGGEDLHFIARRLAVCAAEDVGLADPRALQQAMAAWQAVERLGMPEARIPLAQAAIYVARAPKSRRTVDAIDAALRDVRSGRSLPVPEHLRDHHGREHPTAESPEPRSFLPSALGEVHYSGEAESLCQAETERRVAEKLRALGRGDLNSQQLAESLGLPRSAVVAAVRKLAADGRIKLSRRTSFHWESGDAR